jgi:hypothetical protein
MAGRMCWIIFLLRFDCTRMGGGKEFLRITCKCFFSRRFADQPMIVNQTVISESVAKKNIFKLIHYPDTGLREIIIQ